MPQEQTGTAQPPVPPNYQPNPAPAPYPYAQPVPNHMTGAILATILLCWPLGIVAIVYASKVNDYLRIGDIAGAQRASQSAKNWIIASAIVTGVIVFLYILFFALSFAFSATQPI